MDYREYSYWDTLWNRMKYPVRDAYLNAGSLETASPEAALRVKHPVKPQDEPEPRLLRLKGIGQQAGNR